MKKFVSALWVSVVHLFQPTPGTVSGVAVEGDLVNSRISSILALVLSFVALHAANVTGLLTHLGISPSIASLIIGWITMSTQMDKKMQDTAGEKMTGSVIVIGDDLPKLPTAKPANVSE